MTDAAQRMAVCAGVRDPFARAESILRELCGWDRDDDTIRTRTHAAARRAMTTRDEREDDERFGPASGAVEVAIDAGKVNADTGWRDVTVAASCKRKAGASASLEDGDKRTLPTPSVRTVVAAIEEADRSAGRVRTASDRLGATTASDVTVRADGAEWIGNVGAEVFPQATGVSDPVHAPEHIADAVKGVWGNDAAETTQRTATGRWASLGAGESGIEQWIAAGFDGSPTGVSGEPRVGLAAYLAKHPTRLGYAERRAGGRSIGSGRVEGPIEQLVNRRLKQTGAKWKVANVGPLVELAAPIDAPDWNALWTAA